MIRLVFVASLVVCLSACGTSPKTHFYRLSPSLAENMQENVDANSVRVGLWKIKLPEMLDRSEIVTRSGPYSIELSDFHRWADRLDNNMSRLIAHNLGTSLQTDRVVVSPWPAYADNDYQVKILVDQFDGELGGNIVLSGTWSLLNGGGDKELVRKTFAFKNLAAGNSYSDMIAALSKLTEQLAEQVSQTIAIRRTQP